MRVFLLGGDVPFRRPTEPGVGAANIALSELVRAILDLGHEIVLQLVFGPNRPSVELSLSERAELQSLGVRVLQPFFAADYLAPATRAERLVELVRFITAEEGLESVYPSTRLRHRIGERIDREGCDAVIAYATPEGSASTFGLHRLPKAVWQGSVDFRAMEVRQRDRVLFGVSDASLHSEWRRLRDRARLSAFRRQHVRLMGDFDLVACAGADQASYYRRAGIRRVRYLGLLCSDPGPPPQRRPSGQARIVGHLGRLDHTSSTYGMRFLLTEVLPALSRHLDPRDFQIHIIGEGSLPDSLRPWASHPSLVYRGWVKDLDEELRQAHLFWVLDNAGPYPVSCTRHVVAWSLGVCQLVHARSTAAIPEIRHLENALVAGNGEEAAHWTLQSLRNEPLRARIAQEGRALYERRFAPKIPASEMLRELERLRMRVTAG